MIVIGGKNFEEEKIFYYTNHYYFCVNFIICYFLEAERIMKRN